MKTYLPQNKKETQIFILFGFVLPYLAGVGIGSIGRHLIKKSRGQS